MMEENSEWSMVSTRGKKYIKQAETERTTTKGDASCCASRNEGEQKKIALTRSIGASTRSRKHTERAQKHAEIEERKKKKERRRKGKEKYARPPSIKHRRLKLKRTTKSHRLISNSSSLRVSARPRRRRSSG